MNAWHGYLKGSAFILKAFKIFLRINSEILCVKQIFIEDLL